MPFHSLSFLLLIFSWIANGLYYLSYDDSMVVVVAVDYEYACSFISYFSFSFNISRQSFCWERFLWSTSLPLLTAPSLAGFFVAFILAVFSISASSSSSLLAVYFLQAHSFLPPLSGHPLPLLSSPFDVPRCTVMSALKRLQKIYNVKCFKGVRSLCRMQSTLVGCKGVYFAIVLGLLLLFGMFFVYFYCWFTS